MGAFIRRLLSQLLDVKSLVTLMLTGVFGHMTATGQVDVQSFLTIFPWSSPFTLGPRPVPSAQTNPNNKKYGPSPKGDGPYFSLFGFV